MGQLAGFPRPCYSSQHGGTNENLKNMNFLASQPLVHFQPTNQQQQAEDETKKTKTKQNK